MPNTFLKTIATGRDGEETPSIICRKIKLGLNYLTLPNRPSNPHTATPLDFTLLNSDRVEPGS